MITCSNCGQEFFFAEPPGDGSAPTCNKCLKLAVPGLADLDKSRIMASRQCVLCSMFWKDAKDDVCGVCLRKAVSLPLPLPLEILQHDQAVNLIEVLRSRIRQHEGSLQTLPTAQPPSEPPQPTQSSAAPLASTPALSAPSLSQQQTTMATTLQNNMMTYASQATDQRFVSRGQNEQLQKASVTKATIRQQRIDKRAGNVVARVSINVIVTYAGLKGANGGPIPRIGPQFGNTFYLEQPQAIFDYFIRIIQAEIATNYPGTVPLTRDMFRILLQKSSTVSSACWALPSSDLNLLSNAANPEALIAVIKAHWPLAVAGDGSVTFRFIIEAHDSLDEAFGALKTSKKRGTSTGIDDDDYEMSSGRTRGSSIARSSTSISLRTSYVPRRAAAPSSGSLASTMTHRTFQLPSAIVYSPARFTKKITLQVVSDAKHFDVDTSLSEETFDIEMARDASEAISRFVKGKGNNLEECQALGLIGEGSQKIIINGKIGDEYYALSFLKWWGSPMYAVPMGSEEALQPLQKELEAMVFGEGVIPFFRADLKNHTQAAYPSFRFNIDGAFVGYLSEPPLVDLTGEDWEDPYLAYRIGCSHPLATKVLPYGPIETPFRKFTGGENDLPEDGKSSDILEKMIHAFAHFINVWTSGEVLITDLQGLRDVDDVWTLIDPQIWFSGMDRGSAIIKGYFELHECQQVCRTMSLKDRVIKTHSAPSSPEAPPPKKKGKATRKPPRCAAKKGTLFNLDSDDDQEDMDISPEPEE